MARPTRERTAGEWILIGATFTCWLLVILVIVGGWLNLLGLWPWP